jgi:hypothetical protein
MHTAVRFKQTPETPADALSSMSAVIASLGEAITESKDLYTSTGVSRGVSADVAESASKAQSDQLIGLLRLRFRVRKANQKQRSG